MNDNARMAEYVATAKRGKNMKKEQFEIDLNELYWNWWSNSVADTEETLTQGELIAWFMKQIELKLPDVMRDENQA
jgi:hypothetical protein